MWRMCMAPQGALRSSCTGKEAQAEPTGGDSFGHAACSKSEKHEAKTTVPATSGSLAAAGRLSPPVAARWQRWAECRLVGLCTCPRHEQQAWRSASTCQPGSCAPPGWRRRAASSAECAVHPSGRVLRLWDVRRAAGCRRTPRPARRLGPLSTRVPWVGCDPYPWSGAACARGGSQS